MHFQHIQEGGEGEGEGVEGAKMAVYCVSANQSSLANLLQLYNDINYIKR